jgi:phosphohistidine swiveling domain-containing protein
MKTAIVVHGTSLLQNQRILYAVQSLCLTLQNYIDFELSNIDGKNVISRWSNTTIAQPTEAQLEAVDTDAIKAAALVPQSISDRQFFQQLAVQSIIAEDEALQANAAVIPSELMTLINGLPADQQFAAKMKVSRATTFYRTDPLTLAIGCAYGWSAAQIDAFFVAAAKL